MKNDTHKTRGYQYLEYIMRAITVIIAAMMLVSSLNPARVTVLINENMSLFTSAMSYDRITEFVQRAFNNGWAYPFDFHLLHLSSLLMVLSIVATGVLAALSLGNLKFKKLVYLISVFTNLLTIIGAIGIYLAYTLIASTEGQASIQAQAPNGIWIFMAIAVILLIMSLVLLLLTPKPDKDMKYEMARSKQLLVMYLPIAILVLLFMYLPLWGWRYSFFDYQAGDTLSFDNFVGFYWFKQLLNNSGTRETMVRVLRNTLIMSGLGIAGSWIPMVFAVFLAEITSTRFKRLVQIFTTIPNFISWVLVYALAIAVFSTDGFINNFLLDLGWIQEPTNYLTGNEGTWFKMWLWGLWKGLGWSAIIYIAAISSIDPVLYESAKVDGANRFQKMRYITIPSILPTYFVLLVLSVAAILSNGMDQYYVFHNSSNDTNITVLDLYVYQLGIDQGSIPLSTLIGMFKSLISVTLLLTVNKLSKFVRGESVL